MPRCTACGQTLVRVTYGPEGAAHVLLLSAEVPCYAVAAFDALDPQDGDRVFRSLALPLHSATCPGQRARQKKGESKAEKPTPSAGAIPHEGVAALTSADTFGKSDASIAHEEKKTQPESTTPPAEVQSTGGAFHTADNPAGV